MRILFVSSEVDPFSKVGGLGDVVSSLAKELAANSHDIKVLSPLYGCCNLGEGVISYDHPMIVNMGYGIEFCKILEKKINNVSFNFVEFNKYFGRAYVYGENGYGYLDNWKRFTFLCRCAIDFCEYIQWTPDVIHSHDWPTALINVYLKTTEKNKRLGATKSIYTIHNMGHHGPSPKALLSFAGLPEHLFHPYALESLNFVNLMKGGIQFADKITTVSKTYAKEITTKDFGCGLDDVLRYRSNELIGICNGVDSSQWNALTDKLIAKNFSYKNLLGKHVCKMTLQKKLLLPKNNKVPIFAVISRFYEQKGLDILCDILPSLLSNMSVQFVILGSGDKFLCDRFCEIQKMFSSEISVTIGYDNQLSHEIEAGSDFFVMPSRYEPCGLNQIYSMLYGTLPIVRATGGLKDTVRSYNEQTGDGTGFVFNDLTHDALYNAIGWAANTFYNRHKDFVNMQKTAMQQDFSWKKSVSKYLSIYNNA